MVSIMLVSGAMAARAQDTSAPAQGSGGLSIPQTVTENKPAVPWPWMEAWSGFGMSNGFYGGWFGAVIALNQTRNVWADGFVIRVEGLGGHYRYTTTGLPTGVSRVPMVDGALMLGYRKVLGSTTITVYGGLNAAYHDNKDPTARVRGAETNVKVLAELYSQLSPFQDVYAQASFSGAFQKWSVLLRPGFSIRQDVWVGPELQAFGNEGAIGSSPYKEGRVGAFVQWRFPGQTLSSVLISGGFRAPLADKNINSNRGKSGYYVQVGTGFRF